MDYSESCLHTIRLIEKLKSLDIQNFLDFELINKAIYFAKEYHTGQFRKSGEPFYTHPLEVAYIVSDYNLKTEVIVTSILHDILEDTEATEKPVNELNTFFLHQDISTNKTLILSSRVDYPIQQEQLPDFHIMINTPPPDLA